MDQGFGLWDAAEQFDESAEESLAVAWENMAHRGFLTLALDDGVNLYNTLTRSDGWHPHLTSENANKIGKYVMSVFSVLSLLARVA